MYIAVIGLFSCENSGYTEGVIRIEEEYDGRQVMTKAHMAFGQLGELKRIFLKTTNKRYYLFSQCSK
jgi:RimJ/RimL family protein N-acetyltransferase